MRRHKDEIFRWLNSPDDTKVWINKNQGRGWYLYASKTINCWYDEHSYIVDDEWAELRKAQADCKQLEFNITGNEWICKTLMITEDTKIENISKWRIKPEEPIYEWQWIYPYTKANSDYFGITEHCTESQAEKDWEKIEQSKRARKGVTNESKSRG